MRILVIGKNSYIGKGIRAWLGQYQEKYVIDAISVREDSWRQLDFSCYDAIINLAGIAHINNITSDMKDLFYSINKDLVIALGQKAKNDGVGHFIHFSSMNVYGDYCDNIHDRDVVNPTSFYGDSKLQGDLGLENLSDDKFIVSCIRPPFVYGKGCSGNYKIISQIAKKMPIFPDYPNKKSMIHIENLCEFVRLVIDGKVGGYLTPQNKEIVSTSDLVREIASANGKRIRFTKIFNRYISIGNKLTRQVRRAFADDCYDISLSDYFDFKYCVVSFKDSIRKTESSTK